MAATLGLFRRPVRVGGRVPEGGQLALDHEPVAVPLDAGNPLHRLTATGETAPRLAQAVADE